MKLLGRMRIVAIIALLFVVVDLSASDALPNWSEWQLGIHPNSCILMKEYTIPNYGDSKNRGFLSGSPYYRVIVRIHVSTRTDGTVITANQIGQQLLALQLTAIEDQSEKERVVLVDFGGVLLENQGKIYGQTIEDFWLSENDTKSILDRLEKNEAVPLVFHLANGTKFTTKIYDLGNRNFYVWREVFDACAAANAT